MGLPHAKADGIYETNDPRNPFLDTSFTSLVSLLKSEISILSLKFKTQSKSHTIYEIGDPKNPYFDISFNFSSQAGFANLKDEMYISGPESGMDQISDRLFILSKAKERKKKEKKR